MAWQGNKSSDQPRLCVVQLVDPVDQVTSSATFIGRNNGWGIFLTPDHVVHPWRKRGRGEPRDFMIVKLRDVECRAEVIRRPADCQADVALLRVNPQDLNTLKKTGLRSPRLSFSKQIHGEVILAGFPANAPMPVVVNGSVSKTLPFVELLFPGDTSAQNYLRIETGYGYAETGMSGGETARETKFFRFLKSLLKGTCALPILSTPMVVAIIEGRRPGIKDPDIRLPLSFGIHLDDFVRAFPRIMRPFKRRRIAGFLSKALLPLALVVSLLLGWGLELKGKGERITRPSIRIARLLGRDLMERTVTLITGRMALQGDMELQVDQESLPKGSRLFVLQRERYEIRRLVPEKMNRNLWRASFALEFPQNVYSIRFEFVVAVDPQPPPEDRQAFYEWAQRNGVVTAIIKLGSLRLSDPIRQSGAYADLTGLAENLPEGTVLEFECQRGGENLGSALVRGVRTTVVQGRWRQQVPLRGPYDESMRYCEMVVLARAISNTRIGLLHDIKSDPTRVTVPRPEVAITKCSIQRRPRRDATGLATLQGTIRNILQEENITVVIYGYDARNAEVGRWFGLADVHNDFWSANVEVKAGEFFDGYAVLGATDPGTDKSKVGTPLRCW